jgi:hypothetical protein
MPIPWMNWRAASHIAGDDRDTAAERVVVSEARGGVAR